MKTINPRQSEKILRKPNIEEVLIDAEAIKERVKVLASEIIKDYNQNNPPVFIGILKGSLYFFSDLTREIPFDTEIEFMSISSYGSATKTSGVINITKDLEVSITDRHVLIIEDIVDTGLTLNFLLKNLKTRNPTTIRVCALLDKPSRRQINVPIAYLGFTIPDKFVIGYGLDFEQRYRNLPYIGTLE